MSRKMLCSGLRSFSTRNFGDCFRSKSGVTLSLLDFPKLGSVRLDRRLATHSTFPILDIPNEQSAKSFLKHLTDDERSLLRNELQQDIKQDVKEESGDISGKAIVNLFLFHGIPFVGFGILDNLVMIVAGEYIDIKLGALFGISTMAAAALGNLVSDVMGVGTTGYVEMWTGKVGVHPPDLSSKQSRTWRAKLTIALGRAIGISVGCLIGMFPLLFYDAPGTEKKKVEKLKVELKS